MLEQRGRAETSCVSWIRMPSEAQCVATRQKSKATQRQCRPMVTDLNKFSSNHGVCIIHTYICIYIYIYYVHIITCMLHNTYTCLSTYASIVQASAVGWTDCRGGTWNDHQAAQSPRKCLFWWTCNKYLLNLDVRSFYHLLRSHQYSLSTLRVSDASLLLPSSQRPSTLSWMS